ncbi:MAG TPA: hypothetical protein VNZ49_17580 [Bacteroidia bacterium]|jgi:hypothetical protein|nr:hypothetical protein [Bacteroidia bacterium]
MKNILRLTIVFLSTLTCVFGQTKRINPKDTNEITFYCNPKVSQPAFKSSLIVNLKQGDTLALFAEFADCGEWGGHRENIIIVKKDNDLLATYYKDTVDCDSLPINSLNLKRKNVVEKSKLLTSTDRNRIIKYIDNLKIACKKKESPQSNSANSFRLYSKGVLMWYTNWQKDWKEFTKLKVKIFG